MKGTGIGLTVLLILLIVGGYFATASGQGGVLTTISGAKRFDHFTVTNVSGSEIQVRIKVFKEGTTTPIVNETFTIPAYQTRGKVLNMPDALANKAECRLGTRSCVVQLPADGDDFNINSVRFVVESPSKMSGEATLVAKNKSTSETLPQID